MTGSSITGESPAVHSATLSLTHHRRSRARLPLHMVVLDTDWHTMHEPGCPHNNQGYKWNATLFPDPPGFQNWLHSLNLSLMVNIHDQGQFDACQHNYTNVMAAVGNEGWKTNASLLCNFEDEAWSAAVHSMVLETGDDAGIDYLWTDFGGAPSGEFTGNAEWQCVKDTPPVGLTSHIGPATPGHGCAALLAHHADSSR
jgi:alpha-glucosidase (family GH31 glycosyl hydrolase)